ncbi:MAG: hypothetical protein U0U69_15330 [Acidimicrobiia bacterium]
MADLRRPLVVAATCVVLVASAATASGGAAGDRGSSRLRPAPGAAAAPAAQAVPARGAADPRSSASVPGHVGGVPAGPQPEGTSRPAGTGVVTDADPLGGADAATAGAPTPANAPAPDVPFPNDVPGATVGRGTSIGACPVFPADNAWNTDVSGFAIHPNSANYIADINTNRQYLHADFGTTAEYGIPFVLTRASDPLVPVVFEAYGDESDPGPYRLPLGAPIEGGASSDGDRHAIGVDVDNCRLYELYRAFPTGGAWHADSGTSWDLRSNALRPENWTSADAAGLPIFPGLVRYDEVASGRITHALRFTVQRSQKAHIWPATHHASSSTDPNRPPMGLRVRLKASYDVSRFRGQARVILEALRTYGMIVADNGTSWFVGGTSDPRWDDTDLDQLKSVPGSAFEAVDTGPLRR